MELDRDLYQRAFSKITLSESKREEILKMTEQAKKPKRFVGRKLLIAAAAVALAAALAMGANAASGGELGERFVDYLCSFTAEDGTEVKVYQGKVSENDDTIYIATDAEIDPNSPIVSVEGTGEAGEGKPYASYSVSVDDDGNVKIEDYQKYKYPEKEVETASAPAAEAQE